ncbi:FAD-dependent oxidoreductase [Streptomyces sp. NPDC007251]|uniref:FAD-dependent oxidoreductase n=1 Tax=Streptomyces sp. NPDC007251 TaxID=3154483 RepID=UPI0034068D5D
MTAGERVVVVGAGVAGLTTGVVLAEAGASVRVMAEQMPGATSLAAGRCGGRTWSSRRKRSSSGDNGRWRSFESWRRSRRRASGSPAASKRPARLRPRRTGPRLCRVSGRASPPNSRRATDLLCR